MSMPTEPPACSLMPLTELPGGWQALTYAVVGTGTLAVIATDVDLAGEQARIRAMQERLEPPRSRWRELIELGTALLLTWDGSGWREVLRVSLEAPFPRFDRFADGRWLVAGSPSDGGARVLSPEGAVIDRFTLGHNINHLGIDAEDRIWVGWSDEGIFGNADWRVSGQEWPPSSNGVACIASDGTLLPLPTWPTELEIIAHCYALNAAGSGAWACPYTEFPLVRFVPGEPARWWRSDIAGPEALAIEGDYAVLAGGYTKNANRLALVRLDGEGKGEHASLLATWKLPLRRLPPSSNSWAPVWARPSLLTGRGDTLHLVDDGVWYRWRVQDLIPS